MDWSDDTHSAKVTEATDAASQTLTPLGFREAAFFFLGCQAF
jgi:hypothetical protein